MKRKSPRGLSPFTQSYIKQCFDAWYLNGRPSRTTRILEIIPADDMGKKPSSQVLNKWITQGAWDEWADTLDAKAIQKSDELLIRRKVAILNKHQQDAEKLAVKAHEYLMSEGFDTSASAVQAYFRATEEQRKIVGFSDLLERLDKMRNEELTSEIMDMLKRASESDQVIDVEEVVEQLTDGKEKNETED